MSGWIGRLVSNRFGLLLIAALPLIELKGAIPYGVALGLDIWQAFWLAYLGSCLPALPVILALRPLLGWMSRVRLFSGLAQRLERRLMKNRSQIDRYGIWGLFLFVAIPLPGTGVWTGSGIAALLRMPLLPSLAAIVLGNLCAGLIVAALSWGIFSF